jgi:putative transposase
MATRAMPKVFRRLYYHVVWATKNRTPLLSPHLRPLLFEVIGEKCRALGCQLHAVNAVEDHVHLALEIPPALAVGNAVGQIKGAASHALNESQPEPVYWQDGYGVVTFRGDEMEKVCQYIASQEERHAAGGLSPLFERCFEEEAGNP